MSERELKASVRERYGSIARGQGSCCGPSPAASPCCGSSPATTVGKAIGYSEQDLESAPEGANLGLGCGNPLAFALLEPGNVVVDLGSGAGFDCFLAARKVGPEGRVIGVDMTPDMLDRARANAAHDGYTNVEFRLGEIEHLPVADNTADMVISNCVINLSTDKPRVFAEALRVLKPGGRLMISDLVLERPLPEAVARSVAAYVGCIAGAMLKDEYLATIRDAGFQEVKILAEATYPIGSSNPDPTELAILNDPTISREDLLAAAASVTSVKVTAVKR